MADKLCIIGMGMGEVENYYREMERALQVWLAYDKTENTLPNTQTIIKNNWKTFEYSCILKLSIF